MSNDTPFNAIVGEQLSAVALVQDYVELHFDGPVVRALANPIIGEGAATISFPEPGSRDRLCGLIARSVTEASLIDGQELRISLEGGATITIPMDSARCPWPEAIHFQESVTGPVQIWNTECTDDQIGRFLPYPVERYAPSGAARLAA